MAQGRAEKSKTKPKRKKKNWQPPPRELERLTRAREHAAPMAGAIQEFAESVVRALYGEQGPEWGTTFADIEALSSSIGKAVATALATRAVAAQVETGVPDQHAHCPSCHARVARISSEPRSVQTLDGLVEWMEPEHTCNRCRKAFFPSESNIASRFGTGQPGTPAAAQQTGE